MVIKTNDNVRKLRLPWNRRGKIVNKNRIPKNPNNKEKHYGKIKRNNG